MQYKQVILAREDLKLPKGKLAAQCSHASVDATLKSDKKIVDLIDKNTIGTPLGKGDNDRFGSKLFFFYKNWKRQAPFKNDPV